MSITPQGSSAQLKEYAQIIISDTSMCFGQVDLGIWLKELVTKLYWQITSPYL